MGNKKGNKKLSREAKINLITAGINLMTAILLLIIALKSG